MSGRSAPTDRDESLGVDPVNDLIPAEVTVEAERLGVDEMDGWVIAGVQAQEDASAFGLLGDRRRKPNASPARGELWKIMLRASW
jgi:hypothetical protein